MLFACYLLTPVQPPQRLRCTYVGFTVAPTRRIRQHNGEVTGGAKRTRKFRPWEMVAVVHGFPSKFRALQFEWVWQHPLVSKVTKTHLAFLRGSRGLGAPRSVKRKVLEVLEMVNLEPFKGLELTVSFTSDEVHNVARGLGARYAAAKCETRALETFASVGGEEEEAATATGSSTCFICEHELDLQRESGTGDGDDVVGCYRAGCEMSCHSACLMDHFRSMREEEDEEEEEEEGGDVSGECPECRKMLEWSLLTQHHGREKEKRKRKGGGRRKRGRKKARTPADDADESDLRGTNATSLEARSVDSLVSASESAVEYDSDGWFEDDRLDAQVPLDSNEDAETIDLTED
ncbi:hypothetical protein PHYPSEUDO_008447 [Phytophthora pseudosyringae]|uniref:Structure-specific endonuclease subunit SLX1 homolog n=1 Tax=Phytophthora pseudosyringae TaxID=221518 RepID=A0A8T1VF33_9STRA|nr:hypothetical protein PHYPSEUDO_008447 [Phytophthora pseudosyringae]